MKIAGFDFNPAFWPSLATLVLLPLLVYLGNWQLQRAAWKQDLIDTQANRAGQVSVPLASLSGRFQEFQYVPVRVHGRYDLEHQLLLDNRTHDGRAGYHVLTPLLPAAGGTAVLVNRGWVPTGDSRARLPHLPGPASEVELQASIKLPPVKFLRLDDAEELHEGWPQVVQQMKLPQLEQRLGYPLLPVLLLLDPGDEYGFVREWKAVHGIIPDKHRAYALQWYTLAVVLLAIYIGVNTKRASGNPQE